MEHIAVGYVYYFSCAERRTLVGNIATEKNESVKIELVIMIGSVGRLLIHSITSWILFHLLKFDLIKIFYCHNLCDIKILKNKG